MQAEGTNSVKQGHILVQVSPIKALKTPKAIGHLHLGRAFRLKDCQLSTVLCSLGYEG